MRERAKRILGMLEKYQKQYKKIAVVAHFYTINSLITPHEQDLESNFVHNAEPYFTTLADLNKLK